MIDYLVIGAGPAGLQLGHFLYKARRNYMILEAGDGPGTFFRTFPRHRRLVSATQPRTGTDDPELNLRVDGNSLLSDDPALLFTRYSKRYFPHADDVVRYLEDFGAQLDIRCRTRAVRISRNGHFEVLDQRGDVHSARRLVVATGLGKPFLPTIPGIETAERYATASTDPADFTDQRVLIIGAGDSALETADHLVDTAAVVHVVGRGHARAGHLRLTGEVRKVVRDQYGYVVTIDGRNIRYDRVIACTGFRFNADPFAEDCRPRLDGRFPAVTAEWESVNVPDLFFTGALMRDDINGFRYLIRAQQRMFDRRYHGAEWPGTRLRNRPEAIAHAILGRVNRSSALWLQPGLADLVVTNCDHATYYEEMPVDCLPPSGITVMLERAADTAYLHPVVRCHRRGELTGTHRVAENLEHDWSSRNAHVVPLERFLARQLAVPAIA